MLRPFTVRWSFRDSYIRMHLAARYRSKSVYILL